MDDTLQELENELQRLTPRRPSATLLAALEHELGADPVPQQSRRAPRSNPIRRRLWAGWSLAGAAAALAVVAGMWLTRDQPVSVDRPDAAEIAAVESSDAPAFGSARHYEPIHVSSVLYDLQEGAPTPLSDRSEGRAVRYRYVDTYTWKNPATQASLRWSLPRDEVRLVRATLN